MGTDRVEYEGREVGVSRGEVGEELESEPDGERIATESERAS